MESGADLARELFRRQHNATVRIGTTQSEGHAFLEKLSLDLRRELAMVCAKHISATLAQYCPRDHEACDLAVCVLNLFEALALLLTLPKGEELLFSMLKEVPKDEVAREHRVGLLDVSQFLSSSLGAYTHEPIGKGARYVLDDYTFFAGPRLFRMYRELLQGRDAMLQVYEEAVREQQRMGWSPDDGTRGVGVRRIHYVAVVLTNEGEMHSQMQRYAEAVACAPDYTQMAQVRAYTREYAPQLYALLEQEGSSEAWVQQQQRLLKEEEQYCRALEEEPTREAAAERMLKEAKEELRVCAVCSKPGEKLCSRCGAERYCTRECQLKHWAQHKGVCVQKTKV